MCQNVAKELCCCISALPMETSLLPSPQLSVLHLLNFPTPLVMPSLQGVDADAMFSYTRATHTSSECLQLLVPSPSILKALRACAGQAMLDGKTYVQHWAKWDVFDALGMWDIILEADTTKNAW